MNEENNLDGTSNAQLSLDLGTNEEGSATATVPNDNGQSAEPSDTVFQNGMRWLRADFHLHTKADKEFKYTGNEKEFSGQYISRLKAEDIKIGIITNHNKFDLEEYNRLREEAEKNNIWLVPGTELSVNDGANGIHCLIVFDEKSWIYDGKDYINEFLTVAFSGKANRENIRCNCSLEGLFKILDEQEGKGRDSFIVLAHVNQDNGFFEGLEGGRIIEISRTDLFKRYVLALQKLRKLHKVSVYENWFGRPLPACVEGSDCKSIKEVGKAPIQGEKEMKTYVKIGEYHNFNALKFALSDHKNRVMPEPPVTKNAYIKSIYFKGGKFDGKTINFSPELNSLIGIRGSGKSAIIEAIRYALDISLPKSPSIDKYKNDLITYILEVGCKITLVVVDKNGEEYRIEKLFSKENNIYNNIYDKDGNAIDCSIDSIFGTAVYFGQGDLSNKTESFEYDLVNRLIGNRLIGTRNQIESKKQKIKSLISNIKELRDLKAQEDDTLKSINGNEQKLLHYKGKGIEERLAKKTQIDSDTVALSGNRKTLEEYILGLDRIIQSYETFFSKKIHGTEENIDIINEANGVLGKIELGFEKLKLIRDGTVNALKEYDKPILRLEGKDKRMQDDLAEIKRKLNSEGLDSDEFLSLRKSIEILKLELQRIRRSMKEKDKLEKDLKDEIFALGKLREKEYEILKAEAKKINDENKDLRVEVVFKGEKDKLLNKVKSVFRSHLLLGGTLKNIADAYKNKDFVDVYMDKSNWNKILRESQLEEFKQRFEENLEDLLTYRIDDEVVIKYKDKPLGNHSLGQRASALILFLLARKDTDVLIIDQPEDDLDSQTIYDDVIKELLKLKGNMQFIFATHNANIPVLGDSEKIVACSFDDSKKILVEQGTIDSRKTQDSIVKIMEGGEEAFLKRRKTYSLWRPDKGTGK